MDKKLVQKIKAALGDIGGAAVDGVRQSVFDHEDEAVLRAVDAEQSYNVSCAAAALTEAKVPTRTIRKLLVKYFRIDNERAELAIAEGLIMVAKKNAKKESQENG